MKRTFFKKITVIVLVLAMAFSSVATSVFAVGTDSGAVVTAVADKKEYVSGDTVIVNVTVANCPTMKAMGLTLLFDSSILELGDASWNKDLGAVIADFDRNMNKAAIAFSEETVLSGTVFTAVFTVKSGVAFGVTTVEAVPVIKLSNTVLDSSSIAASVTVKCTHTAADTWSSDSSGHWKECINDCGEYAVEKTAHVYDNDCDKDCNICGYTRDTKHTPEINWNIDADGHWKNCSVCGEITDAKTAHVYDNDTDADCNVCGYIRSDTGHSWGDYQYNETGHWQVCVNDNATSAVSAHTYGDWVVDKEATTSAAGSKHRDCTVCGYTNTAVIPQILKFASASLMLESSISIKFKVNPTYFTTAGYTDPYVVFTMAGEETKVSEYTIESGTGRYVFQFSNLAPYLMNEDVSAVLYAKYDGVEYASAPQPYGIGTYCYNQLSKSTDAEFRTMLVDLLNYGAETQIYKNYKTDKLVNAALTDAQRAEGTQTTRAFADLLNTEYAVIDNPTVTWKAAALLLDDAVIVRVKLAADNITGLTVKFTAAGKTWSIPASDFIPTSGGYYVLFKGLNSTQMSEPIYITVYDGNTAVSNTLRYSIETYVARTQDKSGVGAMVVAMMKYGDSASKYFN